MAQIKISELLNVDLCNYASYDNLRKIASVIDGQKNASRKIIYTILEKNIKDAVKVSQLGAKISEFSDYLHGSLEGTITSMGANYVGSNNVPLIQKKGNYGTRFTQDPSASRYIFGSGSKNLFNLFKKEDNNILIKQEFEGYPIEPRFYVPTLPVLLLNGSEGVSSGFAQKILPRNINDVTKYIINKLKGKSTKVPLLPYYNGFDGSITCGESEKQFLINGKLERISKTTVKITEIPVGYDLRGYLNVLDKLEDDKKIIRYKDLSNDDKFLFEVTFMAKDLNNLNDDELLKLLKLQKVTSENYTCIDENNKIKIFNNVYEIVDHFIAVKLQYMQKRKDYILKELSKSLDILASKIKFIEMVINEELLINNRKKIDILKDLKNTDILELDNYEYLLKMPIYSLTEDKIKELKGQLKETKQEFKTLNETSTNDLWLNDIKA